MKKRRLSSAIEVARRRPWPRSETADDRVGVVVVNYNTVDLTSMLLFTLHRVLPERSISRIVLVDNNSTDESRDVFGPLHESGLIELVRNRWPTTHGPGVNRGMNRLARRADVDLVWVLDSDVLVLRPDTLAESVKFLRNTGAALIGQRKPGHWYAHISSNLLDPARVWRRGISPFWDDGEPGARMQAHLRRAGERIEEFEFYRQGYLLHIGGGTLRRIAKDKETTSPYFEWASTDAETEHYHGNRSGPAIVASAASLVLDEAGMITGERLLGLCTMRDRAVIVG